MSENSTVGTRNIQGADAASNANPPKDPFDRYKVGGDTEPKQAEPKQAEPEPKQAEPAPQQSDPTPPDPSEASASQSRRDRKSYS